MSSSLPESKLHQLELQHADEGQLTDIKYSDALTTSAEEVEHGYFLSPQIIGSICAIALATLASYFAFSPAAAVLTVINADIGPSDNASLFSIIWTTCTTSVAAYRFPVNIDGVGIALFGRISDKLGRRWFVIGASVCGLIGGIIACTANSINTLIGANVLLGLAAGVHTCYGLIIGEVCPNKYKFTGVAAVVVPNVLATGFGAYIGISLTREATWRYIYYIFLVMMGISIVLQFFFYHPPSFAQLHGHDRTRIEEVKRIDWVGAFLLVVGLVLFLLGVSWGGQPLPWSSSRILGLIITGAIVLVIFGLWEGFSKRPNAFVPMHVFKDVRGFLMLCIICAVSGVVYLATAIIWPSQVAVIYATSITSWQTKAWASTTVGFGVWGGIILVGPLVGVIKHVRIQLVVEMAILVAFMGALVTCNSSNFSQSAAFSFLAAFPCGILEIMAGLLVQMDSNDADLGMVFSIVFLFKQAWGTIFTAVFVAILNNKIPTELAKQVPPAAINAGLPKSSITDLFTAIAAGTPSALAQVPGINPSIEGAVAAALANAYADAYAYVYYAAIAVGLVGLIACILIKDYDHYFTDHVPRQIYKANQAEIPTKKLSDGDIDSSGHARPVEKDKVRHPGEV